MQDELILQDLCLSFKVCIVKVVDKHASHAKGKQFGKCSMYVSIRTCPSLLLWHRVFSQTARLEASQGLPAEALSAFQIQQLQHAPIQMIAFEQFSSLGSTVEPVSLY